MEKAGRTSIAQDRQGQAMVEFALVAPLLALFLYAIIQFGLVMYGFVTVQQAAHIGVRDASLGDSVTTIGNAINAQVSGVGLSATATTASGTTRLSWQGHTGTSGSTPTVAITVHYLYPVLIPILGEKTIPIQQTVTLPQEDPPASQLTPSYGPVS